MPKVTVEVDLDDIELPDLIEHLESVSEYVVIDADDYQELKETAAADFDEFDVAEFARKMGEAVRYEGDLLSVVRLFCDKYGSMSI